MALAIQQVLENLPKRPIVLFDCEYGCASLVKQTAGLAADKLMRLRSNRCLYSAPPSYQGRGRLRQHGDKFKLNDPQTWWDALLNHYFHFCLRLVHQLKLPKLAENPLVG